MQAAASAPMDSTEPHSCAQPAAIPGAGHWMASLGYYGDFDWYAWHAGANRSFTLDITALDNSGAATTSKALPVIGLWAPDAAESDAPLAAQTWLNVAGGATRLKATLAAAGMYKFAIADARGDGRPDFSYKAACSTPATSPRRRPPPVPRSTSPAWDSCRTSTSPSAAQLPTSSPMPWMNCWLRARASRWRL